MLPFDSISALRYRRYHANVEEIPRTACQSEGWVMCMSLVSSITTPASPGSQYEDRKLRQYLTVDLFVLCLH